MAVLTDGQEWLFYLPAERGKYDERCVYKLDLLEREITDSCERLKRYLGYKCVCNGDALRDARADHRDATKEREMKDTIPVAWEKLLKEQDGLLVDIVAEATEDLCGYKPSADLVGDFLRKQLMQGESRNAVKGFKRDNSKFINDTSSSNMEGKRQRRGERLYGFKIQGKDFRCNNAARDVLINIFEELTKRDPSFPDRFMARQHGRKRRYMAESKRELYPDRPDLCNDYSYQLSSGQWVGVNYSVTSIQKIIRIAAEVAGLEFGSDLIVSLGE